MKTHCRDLRDTKPTQQCLCQWNFRAASEGIKSHLHTTCCLSNFCQKYHNVAWYEKYWVSQNVLAVASVRNSRVFHNGMLLFHRHRQSVTSNMLKKSLMCALNFYHEPYDINCFGIVYFLTLVCFSDPFSFSFSPQFSSWFPSQNKSYPVTSQYLCPEGENRSADSELWPCDPPYFHTVV